MRILFDKNVPLQLRRHLSGHDVRRADKLGWDQLNNGALLAAAEDAGFDVMVTADQNIAYQQNLTKRKIGLVVLGAGNWPIVRNHLDQVAAAVDRATPNSYSFIEMPLPPKQPYRRDRL